MSDAHDIKITGVYTLAPKNPGPPVAAEPLWVDQKRREVNASDTGAICVNVGAGQPVTITKLYGPLCAADIRVRLDFDTCQWVVEREHIHNGEDPATWEVVARIDAQNFCGDCEKEFGR